MADKYIVDGAAYCGKGDGPLIPTDISHQDATGYAWNNINVFTTGAAPAYGTAPAAGDTVYIRSKNASGADITVNFNSASLTIGSANATNLAPIRWVIDGGTKWSGINGTFKFTQTTNTGNYGVSLRANNWLKAENPGKLVFAQEGDTVDKIGAIFGGTTGHIVENVLFDTSTNRPGSGYGGVFTLHSTSGAFCRYINCEFKLGDYYQGALGVNAAYGLAELVGCTFEFTHTVAQENQGLFYTAGGVNTRTRVIGGEIKGVGAASMRQIVNLNDAFVELIGTKIPGVETVDLFKTGNVSFQNDFVMGIGLDGGVGSDYCQPWGIYSSRADNNPPYLNATLPDSNATPWAWYIYPKGVTTQATWSSAWHPCIPISKLFTDTAAAKKVTVECLISTTCANVNKATVWIDVTYIDNATGLPKALTSQVLVDPGALDSSSASWSSTSWGTKSFNKYKLEVTTPTSIKKDTAVHVAFSYKVAAPNATDVAFLCPDVQLSTP